MKRRVAESRGEKAVSWARLFSIGVAAGLRSMLAPALLSRAASRGAMRGLERSRFAPMASLRAARVLTLLAGGEMIADKTPFVPSRTHPPVLVWRVVSGALSAAVLCTAEGRCRRLGPVLGAAGAVLASAAGANLRKAAGFSAWGLLLALAEDAAAVAIGRFALGGRSRGGRP